ncbi:MAG: hypothetical protein U0163_06435 [Gemmatimonadaceae bacterium]
MRALWRGALSTRVGRRTLVLFVVSALLPTFVLAGLSYAHVRATMERQAATALSESTKRRGPSRRASHLVGSPPARSGSSWRRDHRLI